MRGFEYLIYSAFSSVLLITLILLPLAPAFADEAIPSQEANTVVPETPVVETNATEKEVSTNSQSIVDSIQIETEPVTVPENVVTEDLSTQNEIDEQTVVDQIKSGEVLVDTVVDTTEDVVTTSETHDEAILVASDESFSTTSAEELTVETMSSTTEEISNTPQDVNASTTEETVTDIENIEETTTDEGGTQITVTPENTVTTDENRFTFSNTECTTVGEGVFYCSKKEETEKALTTDTDRVFAAVDSEGDKEIYIEKDSELTQITNNQSDDDAPQYDQLSNTLVWHRLIDGRYQIISYDIEEGIETQITNDRYNNMEPNRFGDATVWQGWVGNDWEIFLLEGEELLMLTDNTTHDIAPSINGAHIVWQSFENDAWKMKVYDMRTKSVQTIEGDGGGSIENPRFVLVYDKKFETGDIETHGYNLENGEIITLGSTPAPVPSEIPDPDQTGEKRALVTPPTQPKTKIGDETDADPMSGDDPELDTDILVIPPLNTDDTFASSTSEIAVPADPTDIVIPNASTTKISSIEHIEDLVITPYVEQIEALDDSQETIATTP